VKRLLILVVVLAASACGDDNRPATPDSVTPGDGSNNPPNATLTSYVIDLVTNHTGAQEASRPYAEFSTLADPDGGSNNRTAYQPLFP
jgi:hypothetical protein